MSAALRLRRMHATSAAIFGIMIPVSMETSLKKSIEYLVFLSVLTPFLNELAAWQSARVEVKQDEQSTQVQVGDDTTVEVSK